MDTDDPRRLHYKYGTARRRAESSARPITGDEPAQVPTESKVVAKPAPQPSVVRIVLTHDARTGGASEDTPATAGVPTPQHRRGLADVTGASGLTRPHVTSVTRGRDAHDALTDTTGTNISTDQSSHTAEALAVQPVRIPEPPSRSTKRSPDDEGGNPFADLQPEELLAKWPLREGENLLPTRDYLGKPHDARGSHRPIVVVWGISSGYRGHRDFKRPVLDGLAIQICTPEDRGPRP